MAWLVEVHSVFRWVVLILGVAALALSVMAATGQRRWDTVSDRVASTFTIGLDLQFLIGIALWLVQSRWASDLALGWLHPLAMVAAIGLAHVGRVRLDRERESGARGRQGAIFFAASLILILVAIPVYAWPL